MTRLFGTDGVRGLANADLTAELALDLSVCAAHVLADRGEFAGHRPLAVVGRDTRISGQFLEAAVVAGLASAGVDVLLLGVLPTPGVAYMTDKLGADLGVMLSASHNPMPDNGIKFLARGGHKLDDAIEIAIERRMGEPWERPTGGSVGRVSTYETAVEEYAAHLESTISHPLVGLKVVLDCAEGAAHAAGPRALEDAGATVIAIHADPDGLNINDNCGSTHLGDLQKAVVEHGAHAGFALDGDADRCLAVDADGNVVDGDQLLAILSLSLLEQGRLAKDTVVATVMSNLGFVQAMRAGGVGVRQTKVGDRYVLEAMKVSGYNLGGEQSGHVILSDHATTGDGILTTLHVMERMATTGRSLADLASVMSRLPQVLLNVSGVDKSRADEDAVLAAAVAEEEAVLGERGRILLRPSGTEPIVRVMVEAPTEDEAEGVASRLADVVRTPALASVTTDPRPGPEEHEPEHRGWLSLGDVAFGIGIGLVLAVVLAVLTPGTRAHLLGGTDQRETTVVSVHEGPRPGEDDRTLTSYELRWSEGDDVRTATFRRSGPPEREVGDTWTLWVSPDGSSVEASSPLSTWLWLGIGMPAFVLVIGALVRWRGRVMARASIREADRIEAARRRRASRS